MFKKNFEKKILLPVLFVISLVIFSCVTTDNSIKISEEQNSSKESVEVSFAKKLCASLENKDINGAIELCEKKPASLKNDYEINYLHASLLFSAARFDESEVILSQLEKIEPENPDNLVLKSMIAKAKGDDKTKKAVLKQIIAKDPTNSDALVEMGNDAMLGKRYKLANTYFEKAVQSDPSNIGAYLGYGQSLYYLNQLEDAEKAFDRMLEINPKSAIAYSYKSKLEMEKQNYKKSYDFIKTAIKYDDTNPDYWIDLGTDAFYIGQNDEAEKAWSRAIELDDSNFYAYICRASYYENNEMIQNAISDYKKIYELKPQYYYALESLGVLYWQEENYEESLKAFEAVYKVKPLEPYALMISACYLKQKKEDESKKFLTLALRNRDQNSVPGAVMRFYYDGLNASVVIQKLMNEENMALKCRYMFYIGLYYEIRGDDYNAKIYYNEVTKMQTPMFYEYTLAQKKLSVSEKKS